MTKTISPETRKLATALSQLNALSFGVVSAQALASAHRLGVFEALADGPMTADDLANQIQLKPIACRRLLMAIASLNLVKYERGKFQNTELGQFCTSRSKVNLGAVSQISPFDRLSEYLTDALREYGPRYQQALGAPAQDAFASLYADPVGLREFAKLMDGLSIPQGQVIAECFDFSAHHCIMDVAGGPGGQSIQIGLNHAHLRGIIMDLEPVCVVARERIEANGLSSRFSAVSADLMTGPYPVGADVILLGHILHDWSDENCRRILNHCAAALPAEGVLLVSESVLNADYSGRNGANLKDLIMLVGNEPDARERSEEEYRSLLNAAGFEVVDVLLLDAPRDLLVAKKR
jgi:3-hydroxy-5-methyl-1-naphthoate 3-O-methyltransferase